MCRIRKTFLSDVSSILEKFVHKHEGHFTAFTSHLSITCCLVCRLQSLFKTNYGKLIIQLSSRSPIIAKKYLKLLVT